MKGECYMLKVFTYMFSDKSFWKKYLALFGIIFLANSLISCSGVFSPELNDGVVSPWYYILFFTGFLAVFIIYGYSISILRTTIENNDAEELPMLNFIKDFVAGAKVTVSGLIFLVAFILFLLLLGLLGKLIAIFNSEASYIILSVIIFLSLLIIAFLVMAMCCRYVVKPSYWNFLNFKSAFKLINCNIKKYFTAFIVAVVVTVIQYWLSMLFEMFLTKIGYSGLVIYSILVSLIWAYQIYVFAGLFARAVETDKI